MSLPRRGQEHRLQSRTVSESIPLNCPYCGEEIDLDIDDTGGSRQSYVQDCPVCCQPWQVEVTRDRDGDWNASLRTGDE